MESVRLRVVSGARQDREVMAQHGGEAKHFGEKICEGISRAASSAIPPLPPGVLSVAGGGLLHDLASMAAPTCHSTGRPRGGVNGQDRETGLFPSALYSL